MIYVAQDTVPPGPILVRFVKDSDRDAAPSTITPTLKWVKSDGTAWTSLTSGTHYTATQLVDGIYAIEFIDDSNGQGLFDTLGGAVLEISEATIDEYYERFFVFDPEDEPAKPASLSTTERNALADVYWRRHADEIESSSYGDAISGGEVISGFTMMMERIGDTVADASGLTKTIKQTDGSTTLLVISLGTGAGPSSPVISQSPVTS